MNTHESNPDRLFTRSKATIALITSLAGVAGVSACTSESREPTVHRSALLERQTFQSVVEDQIPLGPQVDNGDVLVGTFPIGAESNPLAAIKREIGQKAFTPSEETAIFMSAMAIDLATAIPQPDTKFVVWQDTEASNEIGDQVVHLAAPVTNDK